MDKRGYVAMNDIYGKVHLHTTHWDCRTLCGLPCDNVEIAYGKANRKDVTCEVCLDGGPS